ncbi:MAG: elongation factor P maturation arginine rhamnosyltransferase EarP [Burkholderiaceae bacterium]|nr:elongation factor P maturation arginine rhamnosyltransferase EarP [Burkholderiaceae bacterium]
MFCLQPSLDIFCRVIDNFGDGGVCWRFAQRMQEGFGWSVRLFIDQPSLIDALAPQHKLYAQVRPWEAATALEPAQVVVEAFGCDPPSSYIAAMANKNIPPVWINLEYFSAEQFALDCHGLPSPQRNGLMKYFFFPGVHPQSGGLLTSQKKISALSDLPFMQEITADTLVCLMFCYPYAPVEELMEDLRASLQPILLLVAEGEVANLLLGSKKTHQTGSATLQRLDFLPQSSFDHLLARCDLAFVRGEDSLARALLAGVPHIWNIYAQTQETHLLKLHAFLDWFLKKAPDDLAVLNRQIHQAWNRGTWPKGSFPKLLEALPALGQHSKKMGLELLQTPDLGERFSEFVLKKLNS